MMIRYWNRRSGQRGGEIVEFAITFPLILLIFFGIVEISVGFFDQAVLTNASRAAAREVIRAAPASGDWGSWDPEADAEAAAQAAAQRMFTWRGAETLVVTPGQDGLCEERTGYEQRPRVTVTLTYPYRFFVLPAFVAGLADLTLSARTEMCVLPHNPPAT